MDNFLDFPLGSMACQILGFALVSTAAHQALFGGRGASSRPAFQPVTAGGLFSESGRGTRGILPYPSASQGRPKRP